jgi:hypothetical protein
MSTQRREDRGQRTRTGCAEGWSHSWLVLLAWFARALAAVGTAPLQTVFRLPAASFHPNDKDLSPGTPERLATNSLQSDYLFAQLVLFVEQDNRRGSPPCGTASRPAGFRSSLPLTPSPSVLVSVHPSSPQHPAGQCRWTERYDGKRDLHFQYAA